MIGAYSTSAPPQESGPSSPRREELAAAPAVSRWREPLFRRVLALVDGATVLLACVLAAVTGQVGEAWLLWAALFLPAWLVLAKVHGLYDHDHRSLRHLTADEVPSLLVWATTGTATLAIGLSATPAGAPAESALVRMWLLVVAGGTVLRACARALWRLMTPPERTLIVGSGPLAVAVRRKLELFPDIHLRLVGTVDEHKLSGSLAHRPFDKIIAEELPAEETVERIVLASTTIDEALIAELAGFCRRTNTRLSVIPPARAMFGTAATLGHVADLPVIEYATWDVARSTMLLKRVFDVVVSSVALVPLAPVLALTALAVRLDSPGPALFLQRRAGAQGVPFRVIKFRTMTPDAEERLGELISLHELEHPMFKLQQDPRVTRFGRFLRRSSLDELPQLINVLKGDMSIVGPRPEQVELVDCYSEEQRFRLEVKPGITGPMQVYGRGELHFDERLAVERDYIENLSLQRDVRILLLTISTVVRGRGAY